MSSSATITTPARSFWTRGRPLRAGRRFKFLARRGACFYATPLFVVLLFMETTDVIFAVDSILAIFAPGLAEPEKHK